MPFFSGSEAVLLTPFETSKSLNTNTRNSNIIILKAFYIMILKNALPEFFILFLYIVFFIFRCFSLDFFFFLSQMKQNFKC